MSSLNFVRPTLMSEELYEYVMDVGLREPALFQELRAKTGQLADGEMQIAPEQGPLLAMLVKMMGAKHGVEVGTFTGYSSLWVANALPAGGKLICCDVSEEFTTLARKYWKLAGLEEKLELRLGPALTTLEQLISSGWAGRMDYAFIDADKVNYDGYYEACLKLLRPGGLMAIDNTLWDGRVADATVNDPDTVAIRTLNRKIHGDSRVTMSFLPMADGMTLVVKG